MQLEGFANWLPGCERDLKREDAEALLERLAAIADSGREAPECGFEFEWTLMWDRVYRGQAGYAVPLDGEADRDLERAILDELRLEPARYRELARALQLKRTALREADRERLAVDIGEVRAELGRLRNARELYSRAALDDWMADNDWSEGQLRAALEGQLLSRHAAAGVDDAGLLDEARLSGDYPDLKKAALRKRAALAATGSGADPVPAELLAWYFGAVLGEPIPGDLDAWLATIDLDSREDFYRILRAHYACRLASDAEKQ